MVLGKPDIEKESAKKKSKGKNRRRNVQSQCEFKQADRR